MMARPPLLASALALVLGLALLLAAGGCTRPQSSSDSPPASPRAVVVSNAALQSWAAFLLGDAVPVELVAAAAGVPGQGIGPGEERSVQEARLLVVHGSPTADPLAAAARRLGSEDRLRAISAADEAHSFRWLAPSVAAGDAGELAELLAIELPTHASRVRERLPVLRARLEGLAAELDALAPGLPAVALDMPDSRAVPFVESLGLPAGAKRSPRPGFPPSIDETAAFGKASRGAIFLQYVDDPSPGLAEQAHELGLLVVGLDTLRRGDTDLDGYEARLRRNWRNVALGLAMRGGVAEAQAD
jgi:hypothetical protein